MIKVSIIDKKTGRPLADSDILNYSKPIKRAIARSINKTTASGITAIKRKIREKYTLPYKTLGDNIYIDKKAFEDRNNLFAIIKAFGKPLNLSEFKYSIQNKAVYNISTRNKGNQQQVTVEILKGQRKVLPKAFQFKGKDTIVMRTSSGIKTLKGISVSGAFNEVQQVVIPQTIRDRWDKVFTHELEYALTRESRR